MGLYKYILLIVASMLVSCNNGTDVPKDQEPEAPREYSENHRPQFHFSPAEKWMNDPNGMFFYEGEYHLFYQYYPEDIVWGPMHWGHAVSTDLVHWEHLPIALYPDELGYIFSGSAVVDWDNTTGLGDGDNPPIVAIFTHHNPKLEKEGSIKFQYQSIAYSNDKGRTWKKYKDNPVVENPGIKDFRDPKVIWHKESSKWVMVFAAYDKAMLYTSPNLIDWEYASEFGIEGDQRLWECPDLFPIDVEDSGETKWVLITSIQKEAPNGGTATSYFVGDFDGKNFHANPKEQQWLDFGRDNYAFVTWSDVSINDGRRLGIGWMSNWQYAQNVPTEQWRSAMTMSRKLELHKTPFGYSIKNVPVKEYEKLRTDDVGKQDISVIDGETILWDSKNGDVLAEVNLTAAPTSSANPPTRLLCRLSNDNGEHVDIGFDFTRRCFFSDRTESGRADFSDEFAPRVHYSRRLGGFEELQMSFYMDRSSVELFAQHGAIAMTDIFFPTEKYNQITLISENGSTQVTQLETYKLKSIW